jgi:hypothetical protein
MIKEITGISSTKKDLQQFSVVMAVAFAVIAAIMLIRHREYWYMSAAISFAFLFFRFFLTRALLPLQKAWMTIAVIMGWCMSRIMLAIIFYGVFTIIGFIGRLFKQRFIETKHDKKAGSYWIMRQQKTQPDTASYEKQF